MPNPETIQNLRKANAKIAEQVKQYLDKISVLEGKRSELSDEEYKKQVKLIRDEIGRLEKGGDGSGS